MRYALIASAWMLAMCITTRVSAHGMPVELIGADGGLTAIAGLQLGPGFVDLAFDPSEEGGLDFPGATVRTDAPGYDVTGVAEGAALQLEVLSRRDLSDSLKRPRWLWYWDSETEAVVEATGDPDFMLRRRDLLGSLSLDQYTGPTAPTLNITDSLTPDVHQHYLRYELDNVPAAKFGVYGVFVRLSSPGFEPTEPLLFAFRYGVSAEQYALGADAINAAASLRGDYDADGDVDGGDFLVWQRGLGSTSSLAADGSLNGAVDGADLAVWGRMFSQSVPIPGSVSGVAEPVTSVLACAAAGIALLVRRWRRS